MYTTLYLIRHSEPFKPHRGICLTNETILQENEKSPLSINGEKIAKEWANNDQFKNLDVIWSSNYVRTMSTAKYFAYNNNLKVNVDQRLNERIHGVNSYDELPSDFELKQLSDENYKIGYGESRKEAYTRIYSALIDILNNNKGKKIAIIGHSTATMFLLKTWCDVKYDGEYSFKDNVFFDGKWMYLQTFKLIFDENNNLLNIESIK